MDATFEMNPYMIALPPMNDNHQHLVKSHNMDSIPSYHESSFHQHYQQPQEQTPFHNNHPITTASTIDYNLYHSNSPNQNYQPILPSNHNLNNSGSHLKLMNANPNHQQHQHAHYINHKVEDNFSLDQYIYSDSVNHNEMSTPQLNHQHHHINHNLNHNVSYDFHYYDNNMPTHVHSTPCNVQEGFADSSPWMKQERGFDSIASSNTNIVKSEATFYDLHPCQWQDCHEAFRSMEEMIKHVVECHIGSGRSTYECRWRGCKRECKPFPKRHKMLNHFRTHTGEKPFICRFLNCKKAFSRPDSLATHVKTHSDIRPYICPLPDCRRAYYHSRSLRKHLISHTTRNTPYNDLLQKTLSSGIRATIKTNNVNSNFNINTVNNVQIESNVVVPNNST